MPLDAINFVKKIAEETALLKSNKTLKKQEFEHAVISLVRSEFDIDNDIKIQQHNLDALWKVYEQIKAHGKKIDALGVKEYEQILKGLCERFVSEVKKLLQVIEQPHHEDKFAGEIKILLENLHPFTAAEEMVKLHHQHNKKIDEDGKMPAYAKINSPHHGYHHRPDRGVRGRGVGRGSMNIFRGGSR